MTTTASAWSKPGAWALESEEHDAMQLLQQPSQATPSVQPPSSDFPSLAAAAATRIPKKKKAQKLSLSEFSAAGAGAGASVGKFQVRSATAPPLVEPVTGLTQEERFMLPTGPRERSAEELEQANSRGFSGYGSRGRVNGEDSVSRWGSDERRGPPPAPSRADEVDDWGAVKRRGGGFFDERGPAPSRADEVDDWGAGKRRGGFFESRGDERGPAPSRADEVDDWGAGKRRGGFFESRGDERGPAPSRADEVDDWGAGKRAAAPRGGFFESSERGPAPSRADEVDDWGASKRAVVPERRGGGFFESRDREAESWGRRREEGGGERPRLKLQPRTLPLEKAEGDGENGKEAGKSKAANPFGAARPREEVLKEKGQDWKQIAERLDSVKIREEGQLISKKGFGLGNSGAEKTERAWRKPDSVDFASGQRGAAES